MLESSHRNKKGVNAMTKISKAEERGRQRGFVLDTREYALYKEKTLVKTIDKPDGKVFKIRVYWYKLKARGIVCRIVDSNYYTPVVRCSLWERRGGYLRSVGLGFTMLVDKTILSEKRVFNKLWESLDKVDEDELYRAYLLTTDTDEPMSNTYRVNNPTFFYDEALFGVRG